MNLINKIVKEKEIQKKKYNMYINKENELIEKVNKILKIYISDIKDHFGTKFVEFNENKTELTIDKQMCEYYLKLKRIKYGKYIFYFSTNAHKDTTDEKQLKQININMADDEIISAIENSLKYILRRTL